MWWARLFQHHSDIAWDDYEKDYSDLPPEILQPHQALEAQQEACRQLEAAQKSARKVLEVPIPIPVQRKCWRLAIPVSLTICPFMFV